MLCAMFILFYTAQRLNIPDERDLNTRKQNVLNLLEYMTLSFYYVYSELLWHVNDYAKMIFSNTKCIPVVEKY